MKYYENIQTGNLLIDENDYTPYLSDRGFIEITKERYEQRSVELEDEFEARDRERHPERYEDID